MPKIMQLDEFSILIKSNLPSFNYPEMHFAISLENDFFLFVILCWIGNRTVDILMRGLEVFIEGCTKVDLI